MRFIISLWVILFLASIVDQKIYAQFEGMYAPVSITKRYAETADMVHVFNQTHHQQAMWYKTKLDWQKEGNLRLSLNLGCSGENWDGVAFVLQQEGLDAIGKTENGMGYEDFESAFVIVFDTPENEHTPLAKECVKRIFLSGCEDHTVYINWTEELDDIYIHYDGIFEVIDGKLFRELFTRGNELYWGFTTALSQEKSANYKEMTTQIEEIAFSAALPTQVAPLEINEVKDDEAGKTFTEYVLAYNKNNIPTTLGDRGVNVGKQVFLKHKMIDITVWDSEDEDGDTISLYLNGEWILKEYALRNKKKNIKVEITPNEDNYLVLYAHNEGKRPPNTTAITISDGRRDRRLGMSSSLKNCDSVQFILKD